MRCRSKEERVTVREGGLVRGKRIRGGLARGGERERETERGG